MFNSFWIYMCFLRPSTIFSIAVMYVAQITDWDITVYGWKKNTFAVSHSQDCMLMQFGWGG